MSPIGELRLMAASADDVINGADAVRGNVSWAVATALSRPTNAAGIAVVGADAALGCQAITSTWIEDPATGNIWVEGRDNEPDLRQLFRGWISLAADLALARNRSLGNSNSDEITGTT